jgi:hypothetical protein
MVAKKNSKRTTADKATKGRHIKDAKDEAPAGESLAQAEPIPVEAAEAANAPMTETTTTDGPMPAEAVTIGFEQTPADKCVKGKKLSALDAAARVLAETGQAMNCQELIAAMTANGYWTSPKGLTPASTLYSAVLRELKTKRDKARFLKTARGKFALRLTV